MPNTAEVTWSPARTPPVSAWVKPGLLDALRRGIQARCPGCGQTRLFRGFLRPAADCPNCHAPLSRVRADDVPPYVTIMIVGHIVVPLMLWLERAETPPLWVHSAIFLPMTLLMTIGLIRPVKGAVMGLMLHLGMPRPEGDA